MKQDLTKEDFDLYIESHIDCLARVLFVYAKLNAGVRYIQGMNEVIATLYYCFWQYNSDGVVSNEYFESDLFFCFSSLMSEVKDIFLRELDQEAQGLNGKCKAIEDIVEAVDPKVLAALRRDGVQTQFYALRWVMLLMCQELEMPNCIRLWDTLFADPKRFEFLNFVAAAIVIQCRATILEGDFAKTM